MTYSISIEQLSGKEVNEKDLEMAWIDYKKAFNMASYFVDSRVRF